MKIHKYYNCLNFVVNNFCHNWNPQWIIINCSIGIGISTGSYEVKILFLHFCGIRRLYDTFTNFNLMDLFNLSENKMQKDGLVMKNNLPLNLPNIKRTKLKATPPENTWSMVITLSRWAMLVRWLTNGWFHKKFRARAATKVAMAPKRLDLDWSSLVTHTAST